MVITGVQLGDAPSAALATLGVLGHRNQGRTPPSGTLLTLGTLHLVVMPANAGIQGSRHCAWGSGPPLSRG
jgi:hypothetical protein